MFTCIIITITVLGGVLVNLVHAVLVYVLNHPVINIYMPHYD